MTIQINAAIRLGSTKVVAADTVNLKGITFDQGSGSEDKVRSSMEKYLNKHAKGTKVSRMYRDVNNQWAADLIMPKTVLHKFATEYTAGDPEDLYEFQNIDKYGNSTKPAKSAKPTTKPKAKSSNYPEWLASMSDKHREAYFKEHPTSKYAK